MFPWVRLDVLGSYNVTRMITALLRGIVLVELLP